MKIIVRLVLFVFFSFLITPTIICVIKKNADLSAFYSFSEEEQTQKEIIAVVNNDVQSVAVVFCRLNCKLIFSENLSQHDTIFSKIFIPPPIEV